MIRDTVTDLCKKIKILKCVKSDKVKATKSNTRFLLRRCVTVPSSAGQRGHEDKKLLSSSYHNPLIYFDIIQSYFQPGLTSVYCYRCAEGCILILAGRGALLMLANWSFGGEQRGYTASGFCPNRRSFSWEQDWTESPGHRAAIHRAGVPAQNPQKRKKIAFYLYFKREEHPIETVYKMTLMSS